MLTVCSRLCGLLICSGQSAAEGEHPLAVRMLSSCQQAVKRNFFVALTDFLESTNQNTNVNTKDPKNQNRQKFSSGCQEAASRKPQGCFDASPSPQESRSRSRIVVWCALSYFCDSHSHVQQLWRAKRTPRTFPTIYAHRLLFC